MMSHRFKHLAASVLWLVPCVALAQPTPTYSSHGDFSAATWQNSAYTAPPNTECANLLTMCQNSETTTFATCAAGHTGTCYQLALVDQQAPPIAVVALNNQAVWDTSKGGAIQSFTYSQDLIGLASSSALRGEGFGPAIVAGDGNIYVRNPYGTQGQSTPVLNAWSTLSLTVQPADLVLLNKTDGSVDTNTHPSPTELSTGAITFGFWVSHMSNPTTSTQQFDNWTITINASGPPPPPTPACSISPPNVFLYFHRELFHEDNPTAYPLHVLNVEVSTNGSPNAGVPVTVTATNPVFTVSPSQPPTLTTATATTDTTGRAGFDYNPPSSDGFGETDFTATGTASGASFSCQGSAVVGMGVISAEVGAFLDSQAPQVVAARFRDRLYEMGKMALANPAVMAGTRKERTKHKALVAKIMNGELAALNAEELRTIQSFAERCERAGDRRLQKVATLVKQDVVAAEAFKKLATGDRKPAALSRPPHTDRKQANAQTSPNKKSPPPVTAQADYGNLPLWFEPYGDQTDDAAGYVTRGRNYDLYLKPKSILLLDRFAAALALASPSGMQIEFASPHTALRMIPLEPLPGKTNYMTGSDPASWRTGVPQYAQVKYEGISPGVDLVFHGHERRLEFDFIVAPGARPGKIALTLRGADRLELDGDGDLLLHRGAGILRLEKPQVYQQIEGARQPVGGRYVLRKGNRVGFEIASYDAARPLVIDPVLSYASFLGGSNADSGTAVAVDAQGNTYIAGATVSSNFPLKGGLPPVVATPGSVNVDTFVTKIDPTGSTVIYSTFVGGTGMETAAGIAVDSSGNAYVAGTTTSADFPIVQAVQPKFGGGAAPMPLDGFVFKLNPTGSSLVYSTYLGGSGGDMAKAIAVDSSGNAYVTGFTSSHDFPVKNAFQGASHGGRKSLGYDAFVAKLTSAGNDFVYSTYLGGTGDDMGNAIAVDASGNAYVAGMTNSSLDFPTQNALQPTGQNTDAFVAKLNPTGQALVYSTYLGGASHDFATGIAVDSTGSAYVTGVTGSSDFPVVNAAQSKPAKALGFDAFVSKLAADGSALLYSTYLGGSGTDFAWGIAVGADGSAFIAGETDSADFPAINAIQSASGEIDSFVAKLNPAGSALTYSTLLGGSAQDSAASIALDPSGNVYIGGSTQSTDFPATYGAFQTGYQGLTDALVMKLAEGTPQPKISTISAASYLVGGPVAAESVVSGFGASLATGTDQAKTLPLPTTLAGSSINVKDSTGTERLAPLFFMSPGQVNYLIPTGTATGLAAVTVVSGSQVLAAGTLRVAAIAPGLFTASANGQGVAAALAVKVAADHSQATQLIFQCGTGGCTPAPVDLGAATDQIYLTLFGTGIRGRSALSAVTSTVGGQTVPVLYAGAQGALVGLDQVNIGPLPRTLAGKGQVNIVLTVDGVAANTVTVSIK